MLSKSIPVGRPVVSRRTDTTYATFAKIIMLKTTWTASNRGPTGLRHSELHSALIAIFGSIES